MQAFAANAAFFTLFCFIILVVQLGTQCRCLHVLPLFKLLSVCAQQRCLRRLLSAQCCTAPCGLAARFISLLLAVVAAI
jgi:hypothetical protein